MATARARRAPGSALHSDEVCVLRTAALLSSQSGAGKTKWILGWCCNYLPYDIVKDQLCWDWTAFSVGGKPAKNIYARGLKWTVLGKQTDLLPAGIELFLGQIEYRGVKLSQLTHESIIFSITWKVLPLCLPFSSSPQFFKKGYLSPCKMPKKNFPTTKNAALQCQKLIRLEVFSVAKN